MWLPAEDPLKKQLKLSAVCGMMDADKAAFSADPYEVYAMFSFLLAVIYVSFISLGLPDSLLGAAWPVMVGELQVPLSYAGVLSMIIAGGTIVSSLLSDRLTRRFGAGLVTAVSVMMTALALLGFSLSGSFWVLCLIAIPSGLGAGAVDAALNNYVALHYASRHMSWLHCFWGVGATLGPYIMGWALEADLGWQMGYRSVSFIQILLTLVLFLSLPKWKKRGADAGEGAVEEAPLGLTGALKIKGVKAILFAFFGYCGLETTAGLWASSYLVEFRGVDPETAAFFASMFFLGITIGRFASGFVADRIGDKGMIRIGCGVMLAGIAMVILPLSTPVPALVGLVIAGIGAAPVYPSIIHSTPAHFGPENSHAIVGIQMASAYCGSTFCPPIFGLIAQHINIAWYPVYLAALALLLLTMTERVNKTCKS